MPSTTTETLKGWLDRGSQPEYGARPRLTYKEQLLSCALGTWMLTGLYFDGWAHRNLDLKDSITTPYHAILYSGFLAFAAWITWLVVVRNRRAGRRDLAAVPL